MEHRNPRGRPSIREYSIRTPDSFSLYHHIGSDNISIDFRLVSEFNSPETVIVTETRDRTSISIRFQCDRHLRIDHSASLELQGFRTSATSRLIVSDRHWVEPIAWRPDSQIKEITVSVAALSGRHSPSDSGPEFRSNNRSGRRTNNRRNQSRRSPQPNQFTEESNSTYQSPDSESESAQFEFLSRQAPPAQDQAIGLEQVRLMADIRRTMPLRQDRGAPTFTGEAGLLSRYLEDVEELTEACAKTGERIRYAKYYCDPANEQAFQSIEEGLGADVTWAAFKEALKTQYTVQEVARPTL